MKIDRQTLLQQRSDSAGAAKNAALPEEVRLLAKRARDKADVALGLLDAVARAKGEAPGLPESPESQSDPIQPSPSQNPTS